MAVAIEFGSQGSAASSSSVATIASLDFNAEASDRIIAASIAMEDSDTISGVTIGGVAASNPVSALGSSNARAAIWLAAVPTGTSGDVVVTLTSGDATVSVSTHSVTGADATPADTDSVGSVGAATLSITALTIPSDGAGLVGYENNSGTTAVSWTGADVSHDTQIGGTRHSSAIVTVAGTDTITADGSSSAQSLVGVAFGPASGGAATSLPIFSRPSRFMRRRAA